MGELDPAFIQQIENRPKSTIVELEPEEIPVIDLSNLNQQQLIFEIHKACRDWGFFQVINHGVPTQIRRKIETATKEFFDQPLEEKRKVNRDEVHSTGYYESEHTKNVRDWKEIFDFLVQDTVLFPASTGDDDKETRQITNQWPEFPPQFSETCKEYAKEVEILAFKLLELISMSLGLPANRLNGFFEEQTSFIRLNHYPPCPNPELALGVGRHKDAGGLTVLAQDGVGGLEVKRKSDSQWIHVNPIDGAYIINVGDLIQVWSNDRYESVEHRARVNTEKERFSIPLFFNPASYTVVKPLEELLDEQNPPKYRDYSWGKFMAARHRSDFKKLAVDNIQIHQFRI